MTGPVTGIVVPTLGRRPEFLLQSLRSIAAAGECFVSVVAPKDFDASDLIADGLVDQKIDEVGKTLPAAIEQGIGALPSEIRYVNWLGDDDLLRPGALTTAENFLVEHPKSSAVYGRCDYVDEGGETIWTNRSGRWAAPLLRVGPDLVPQPGSLVRRSAFEAIGGLRTDLGWAFDLDMFLRLARNGRLSFVPKTLAAFRWHPDSLSVGQRDDSVREASQVRREHLASWVRPLSFLWEPPVRWATMRAGNYVGRRKK
jgi:hypothetical protein